MLAFRHHVFVCTNRKPDDDGCCAARGSEQVLEKLRAEIKARNLQGEIHVTTCGSLGTCGHTQLSYSSGWDLVFRGGCERCRGDRRAAPDRRQGGRGGRLLGPQAPTTHHV